LVPLLSVFFFIVCPSPITTLFPYTTLFRSRDGAIKAARFEVDDVERFIERDVVQLHADATRRVIGIEQDVHAGDLPDRRIHDARSEEHTSELQSPDHLVCRLLLEKKKKKII